MKFSSILLLIIALIGTGCEAFLNSNSIEIQSDESLFNQESCSFPCWQDLMPGHSTRNEIDQQIQLVNFVSTASIREETGNGDSIVISWWHTTPIERSRIVIENDILTSIEIFPHIEFTLQDILSAFGEPTAVKARLERTEQASMLVKVYMFYPDIGTVFQFQLLSATTPYLIEQSIEGKKFYLYPPVSSIDEFVSAMKVLDGQALDIEEVVNWSELRIPFNILPNDDTYLKPPIFQTTVPES